MIQSEKVKQLQKWLTHNNEIELAVLYGSYAKGTHTSRSDLDLAIQLASGSSMTAQQKLDYLVQLGNLLRIDIDLIDLKRVGQPLLSQIMKYGELVKGSQTCYAELAIRNINSAQDFLPYIQRIMAERRMQWL